MTTMDTGAARPPALWDRVVRVSHWGIAIVVLVNEVITRGGSPTHVWFGWIGLTLLVIRLLWGLIGSREARFSAFPPNPRAAIAHMKELLAGKPRHYGSHNPAGAIMVYALWGAIAVMIATGFVMSGPNPFAVAEQQAIVDSGDWSQLVKTEDGGEDEESDGAVKVVHEAMANLILLLVGLHVAGVFVESLMMRRNLVPPMLLGERGNRQAEGNRDRA
jgi:cytochrome b